MSGRFRSDASWSAAGTVLPVLLAAASTPVLLHLLGAEAFASYVLAYSVVSFAPALDLGVSRTAFRRIAAAMSGDPASIPELAAAFLRRAYWAGLAATAVLAVALVAMLAAGALGDTEHQGTTALIVSLVTVTPAVVVNMQRAILEGARLFRASAGVRIALGALSSVLPPLLCLVTRNVAWLCIALLALRVLALAHQRRVLVRQGLLTSGRIDRHSPLQSRDGSFWRESAWYGVSAPVSLLMSGFDRFVVLAVSGLSLAQLSVFVAPQEVALKAIVLPAAIIPALMVRLAADIRPSAATRQLAERVFMAVSAVMLAACVSVGFGASWGARTLFGSLPANDVTRVLQILALGIFSNAVAQFPAANLNSRGLSDRPALLQLVELPIYLLALPVLITSFGAVGAAWAWTARIVADTVSLLLVSHRNAPELSVRRWHVVHGTGLALLSTPLVFSRG